LLTSAAFAQAPAPSTPKMRGDGPPPEAQPFSITREDPALDEIVDAHATADIMADGFGLTEGPLWMNEPGGGFLLAPGVGEVLADLVIDGATATPLDAFSIGRFAQLATSSVA